MFRSQRFVTTRFSRRLAPGICSSCRKFEPVSGFSGTENYMRIITQRTFGGPEVLELQEADRPQGLPTEVIVRVRAVGLNPVEAYIRSGDFPMLGQPPFTLGWDISGVVEEVVPGVNRFKVGDEVYGMPLFPRQAAAYAEYVAAPSRH